jgi:hypothetical protein
MSKKKRRRRRSGSPSASGSTSTAGSVPGSVREDGGPTKPPAGLRAGRSSRSGGRTAASGLRGAGPRGPSSRANTATKGAETSRRAPARGRPPGKPEPPAVVYPPFAVSLYRGMAAVAGSPPLLLSSFVTALGLWLVYSSTGVIRVASPGLTIPQLEALPPIHSLLDYNFLTTASRVLSSAATFAIGAGLMLARASILAFWIALLLDAFRSGGRTGLAAVRAAAGTAIGTIPVMLAMETGYLGLVAILPALFGSLFGLLGFMAGLIGIMYFFGFAPIVAVAEKLRVRPALQIGVRAARLRGRRHLVMVLGYVVVDVFLLNPALSSPAAPVTPSIPVWIYGLFVSFLQLAVLGALVYRWLAVRGPVLEAVSLPGSALTRRGRSSAGRGD